MFFSVKGNKGGGRGGRPLVSPAQKMSGGDYDGDNAWVCWDQRLVGAVKDPDLPARDLEELPAHEKSDMRKLAGRAPAEIDGMLIQHLHHESDTQACLGHLATSYKGWSELFGANSEEARQLGALCFYQVGQVHRSLFLSPRSAATVSLAQQMCACV